MGGTSLPRLSRPSFHFVSFRLLFVVIDKSQNGSQRNNGKECGTKVQRSPPLFSTLFHVEEHLVEFVS
jgi:hypothetical protein